MSFDVSTILIHDIYCNSVLAGMSDTQLRWLQSVLNAAAWLVFWAWRSEHIIPLLYELFWLRVPERIKFWTLCSGFPMPSWHSTTVPSWDLANNNKLPFPQSPVLFRHADTDRSFQVMMEIVHFQLQLLVPWILCHHLSETHTLAAFRQQLMTVLFRTSFCEDANSWAVSNTWALSVCHLLGGPATFLWQFHPKYYCF